MKIKGNVAQLVDKAIAASGRSDEQIASELGYDGPMVVSMIRQERTKLPITKVRALAAAVGIEPRELMSVVLREYMPEAWEEMQKVYGLRLE